MPSILSRLRGLRAPVAADEPLREADGAGGVGTLTTKGDLLGFDGTNIARLGVGPNAYVLTGDSAAALGFSWQPGGGGGGMAVPGTIPDLALWWESDDILAASGTPISRLRERTPWLAGQLAAATTAVTVDATPLNVLTVLAWGSGAAPYTLGAQFATPAGFSAFVVCRATSSSQRAIIGGATHSLALYLDPPAGTNKLTLFDSGVAALGAATAAWTSGVAFQANVTYDPTSGAYAFRQARAANGSGTAATGVGTGAFEWIGADFSISTSNLTNCSVAAIILYNRVLTPTEITNVENYLFAKWAV